MPKIIDPTVKSQIIKMHLNGKGRNEIARDLKKQGVDVSSGTVSGVLKQYREQPESSNKSDVKVTTFPDKEFKKNKDISIEKHAIVNTQDFEENGYSIDMGRKGLGGPLSFWFTNGHEGAVNNKPSEVINAPEDDLQLDEKSIDEKLEGAIIVYIHHLPG
jgi:hypothetical protein